MNEKPQTFLAIVTPCMAILSVTVMEMTALLKGINGASLAGAMAVAGGIGGYGVNRIVKEVRNRSH